MDIMIDETELCGCRFQAGDYGWYECTKSKNHKDDHLYQGVSKGISYSINWQQHPTKDIILDLKWMESNTNMKEVLDSLIEKYQFLDSYQVCDGFNGPEYGDRLSVWVGFYLKSEITQSLYKNTTGRFADDEPYWKYQEFEKEFGNSLGYDDFNLENHLQHEFMQLLNIDIKDYKLQFIFEVRI